MLQLLLVLIGGLALSLGLRVGSRWRTQGPNVLHGLPKLALGMANSGPLSNKIKAVADSIDEVGRTIEAARVLAERAGWRIEEIDRTLKEKNLDPRKVELLKRKRQQLMDEELKQLNKEVMLRDKKLELMDEEFKLMAESSS